MFYVQGYYALSGLQGSPIQGFLMYTSNHNWDLSKHPLLRSRPQFRVYLEARGSSVAIINAVEFLSPARSAHAFASNVLQWFPIYPRITKNSIISSTQISLFL